MAKRKMKYAVVQVETTLTNQALKECIATSIRSFNDEADDDIVVKRVMVDDAAK